MAGPLTWREVSAPNFSGSASALNTFGTLLNNAAQAGQNAIAGWQANQADQAGVSAMLNDMRRRDPVAAEAMMRGVDPSTLNMGTLKQIQENQLNGMRHTQIAQAVQKGAYDMGRTVRTDQAMDSASPYIQAMQQAAASGNYPAYQQAQAEAYKAGAFNGIPADKLQSILSGNQSNVAAAQASGGRSQQLADAAAVAQFGADSLANDFGPAETAARIINDPKATPGQKMQMLKQAGLDQWGQPAGTSLPGSATGGGAKGKGGAVAAPPGTAQRIDQVFNSLLFTESGGQQFNKDGTVKTSSKGAIGVAQVMPTTAPEAASMAGLPWDENLYKNDTEYNKALGKAYYGNMLNRFGGNEEKALAAYNAGPGAVERAVKQSSDAGKPGNWLQYLPQETQKYVPATLARAGREAGEAPVAGTSAEAQAAVLTPEQAQLAGNAAQRAINVRVAQIKASGIPNYESVIADQSDRGTLAVALTGKEGVFKDAKSADVAKVMKEIEDTYQVQPSVAAEILKRSYIGDGRFFTFFGSPNVRDMLNAKQVEQLGKLTGGHGQLMLEGQVDAMSEKSKNVKDAQAAAKTADAEAAAAELRVKGRPGADAGANPARQNKVKAQEALRAAVQAQNADANLRPTSIDPRSRGVTPEVVAAFGGPTVAEQARAQSDATSGGGRAAADLQRAEARLAAAEPGTQAYAKAEREVQKARRLASLFGR